jgi:hypothetical protein
MGSGYSFKQTSAELAKWATVGFDEDEAFQWGRMGYTSDEAASWRGIGFSLSDANHCRGHGMSVDLAKEWLGLGMPAPENAWGWAPTMYDTSIEPAEAMFLRSIGVRYIDQVHVAWIERHSMGEFTRLAAEVKERGYEISMSSSLMGTLLGADEMLAAFEVGFGDYAVKEWHDVFGWDLPTWVKWRDAGFTPGDARVLSRAFLDPLEAGPWTEEGFGHPSAAAYAARGVSLMRARTLRVEGVLPQDLDAEGAVKDDRLKWSWSRAFSRSRGTSHVYAFKSSAEEAVLVRVYIALANLQAVNDDTGVSMYSSSSQCNTFLDGGVYHASPYGFGGLRGTWVFGDLALALLCDRAGLERPRAIRKPSRAVLSESWEQQRTAQRADLEKRAAAALGAQWLAQLDEAVITLPLPDEETPHHSSV